jgi:hypothetical protein
MPSLHIVPADGRDVDTPSLDMTTCFTKATLARYLATSVRSLDRAAAEGLLPPPDLIAGRSPRWTRDTIALWLRNRPRLPGRRKGVSRG